LLCRLTEKVCGLCLNLNNVRSAAADARVLCWLASSFGRVKANAGCNPVLATFDLEVYCTDQPLFMYLEAWMLGKTLDDYCCGKHKC
jgi:hypothetical protein